MSYFKTAIVILSLSSSILFSSHSFAVNFTSECKNLSDSEIEKIIQNINKQNFYISKLTDCQIRNYKLFAKLIKINSNYFEYSDESIKQDVTFVKNFVREYPNILNYISPKLKDDPIFFKSIAPLYDKALEYASNDLVNNKIFMKEMVNLRAKNFIYASERLQNDFDFVSFAIKKDGLVLRYASPQMRENPILVREAIKSNILASTYISQALQENKKIKNLIKNHNYSFLINIEPFLISNYGGIEVGPNGSRGYHIVNQALFLKQKPLIERSDFFKWRFWEGEVENDVKISTGKIRELSWTTDLKNYPDLVKKVKNFLYQRLNQNTADSLTIISLWVIPSNPDIIIFKMYLLRPVNNTYNNSSINNTSYLVGVAYNRTIRAEKPIENNNQSGAVANKNEEQLKTEEKKATKETPKENETKSSIDENNSEKNNIESVTKEKEANKVDNSQANKNLNENVKNSEEKSTKKDNWVLTIIDSDMDVNLDNDIILRNSHLEYDFWDIYEDKGNKTSNLIFRVKDKNSEYFEIFSKQADDQYKSIFKGGGYNFAY